MLTPPERLDPTTIADWLELLAILDDWPAITGARARRELEATRVPFEEMDLDLAMRQIRLRSAWSGGVYPFAKSRGGVTRIRTRDGIDYSFLVALSLGHSGGDGPFLFELLCQAWLESFLGSESVSVHFGDASGERPSPFADAIDWLSEKIGIQSGGGYRPPARNDGGVDVIAWMPFPDARSTSIVLLGQATVRVDFVSKATDIDPRLWGRWLTFITDPIRFLIIPFDIGDRDGRRSAVHEHGVSLIARRRICELLDSGVFTRLVDRETVRAYVEDQVS